MLSTFPAASTTARKVLLPLALVVVATAILVAAPAKAILGSVSAEWPAAKVKR